MPMSPEEKNVIGGIFDRLKAAEGQPRDTEAEAFIAERIKGQPYAPYVMAQSIYAQEQALINMNGQMEQMQARLQQLEAYAQQMQQQPAQGGGGFLGGLFGGGQQRPAAPPPPPPGMMPGRAPFQRGPGAPMGAPGGAPSGPWGGQPQQAAPGMAPPGPWGQPAQQPQRGGMGFLGTAAMTAAGVAGGIMAANALSSMFSGPKAGGATAAASTPPGAPGDSAAQPASHQDQNFAGSNAHDPGYGGHVQDASYDDGNDYGGGGGGDDWA
jgi:uncharacterized protein